MKSKKILSDQKVCVLDNKQMSLILGGDGGNPDKDIPIPPPPPPPPGG